MHTLLHHTFNQAQGKHTCFPLLLCSPNDIPEGSFYLASYPRAVTCHSWQLTVESVRRNLFLVFSWGSLLSRRLLLTRPHSSLPRMHHQACGWLWSCFLETSIRFGRTSLTWWIDRRPWLARWAFLRSSCQVEYFEKLHLSPPSLRVSIQNWLTQTFVHSASDLELRSTILPNVSEGDKHIS